MREPQPGRSQQEGCWQSGDFLVAWQGLRSASGWVIDCSLSLGDSSEQLRLDTQTPRQSFALGDDGQEAWGRLGLRADATDDALLLELDWHSGPVHEQVQTLGSWRACDPCSDTPSSRGHQTLGAQGQIEAAWTIAGAAQAGLEVEVELNDRALRLSPRQPVWQGDIGACALGLQLRIDARGGVSLEARLRQAASAGENLLLDRFALESSVAEAPLAPWPEQGVALERPREFSSFSLPRSLQPPTPAQWAQRFVSLGNDSALQNALRALPAAGKRQAMQAEATDYCRPDSQRYPGQCVFSLDSLSGPMAQLAGESARILLDTPAESGVALLAGLNALLGTSAAAWVAGDDFAPQRQRLQDSLLALLLSDGATAGWGDALGQALRICHLAMALTAPDGPRLPLAALQDLQQASILLPAALTPAQAEAAVASAAYARPLGFSDLRLIRQHLLRYRLGEVAHIENVMRGEVLERSEEFSRHVETQTHTLQSSDSQNTRQAQQQREAQRQQDAQTSPLGTLKREFDNLKQEYGADGLSVTATGSWTESQTDLAAQDRQAVAYARRLLEQAAARVARKVESERSRRSVEEFVERNRRHFDNQAGAGPLIGVYRWVDAVHRVQVVPNGTRLIVEIVLPNPAEAYVQRCNALNGSDVQAPIPPWQGGDGIAALQSPADISRDNYAALVARYQAAMPPAPPPLKLTRVQALSANPPQCQGAIEIPAGYVVSGGSVSYGWTPPASTTGPAPVLELLLGDTVLSIDSAQETAPGSKPLNAMPAGTTQLPLTVLANGLDFIVHVSIDCSCTSDAHVYLQWQRTVYDAILAAYAVQRADYLATLSALARQAACPAPDAPRDVAAAALQQAAIACLLAPALQSLPAGAPAWTRDGRIMSLTQFLRDALQWPDSLCTYYARFFAAADAQRPDWMALSQAPDCPPAFTAFLEAGSARLLVPVHSPAVLALLYYLSSGGQCWPGDSAYTPVCEADAWLVNALKSMARQPAPPTRGDGWDMAIPTSMLMLQEDARLPDLPTETTETTP